ncbi:ecto-ADP-ribosyltransferase 5-like [Silurus asotus]|uniref:NAD(P)(+)--arginine ADP-ribosyltransferase n=1 Tax=Silurus asotus TaxID=30991 RepID=A0AAD5F8C3_SILAS|nr:ecto-ADP-ribosyltransferase 5-like [Silurus asotus]
MGNNGDICWIQHTASLFRLKMKTAVKFFSTGNNIVPAILIMLTVCCPVDGYKLDMAQDSVDDQFIGCEYDMYCLIKYKILPKEFKFDVNFTTTWNGTNNIHDYFKRIIKVYTSTNGSYSKLNNAVSSGRPNYKTHFNYKAYHFLLTLAIQTYQLKKCTFVYRKTPITFDLAVRGQEMRFGRFASTSLNKNLTAFGKTTCFKIKTCFGADISSMSSLSYEKEVLIPPYEKFKIKKIQKNKMKCDVLYTLESAGRFSNMNCVLQPNSHL